MATLGETSIMQERDGADVSFADSMPASYRAVYSSDEIDEHAAIVERRGNRPALAECWRSLESGGAIVCVVADDQPGLLSIVSAALHLHELDVTTAQIYSRVRADGVAEAVDFFWLRALAGLHERPIQEEEIAGVSRLLGDLIVRQACPDPILPARQANSYGEAVPLVRAFFETAALRGGTYILVVEALDHPGLLLRIARALHAENLDIVASDIRTDGPRVRDRFTVRDPTGARLPPERLAAIRAAVVETIRGSFA
jgi:UTP:GlnB (protein PII) uridylyltransferase